MENRHLQRLFASISVGIALATFTLGTSSRFFSLSFVEIIPILAILGSFAGIAASSSIALRRDLDKQRKLNKRIFIIYSHQDQKKAKDITRHLAEVGFNPWLDEEQILPGQNWKKTINQAIESSFVALFLASSNTQKIDNFLPDLSDIVLEWLPQIKLRGHPWFLS